MNHRSSILLAEDLASEPEQAARSKAVRRCALALAKRLGSPIELIHVDTAPVFIAGWNPAYRRLLQERASRLKKICARARDR